MPTLLPIILLVFSLAIFIGFLFLQVYLSRRPEKWAGLVLPLVGFGLALLVTVFFLLFAALTDAASGFPIKMAVLLGLLLYLPPAVYLIIYLCIRRRNAAQRQDSSENRGK